MAIFFCNNSACPNLEFGRHPFCHACEDEQVEAPYCLCGAPIHARFNLSLHAENRLCLGCGMHLTDDYLRQRWMVKLREMMGRLA